MWLALPTCQAVGLRLKLVISWPMIRLTVLSKYMDFAWNIRGDPQILSMSMAPSRYHICSERSHKWSTLIRMRVWLVSRFAFGRFVLPCHLPFPFIILSALPNWNGPIELNKSYVFASVVTFNRFDFPIRLGNVETIIRDVNSMQIVIVKQENVFLFLHNVNWDRNWIKLKAEHNVTKCHTLICSLFRQTTMLQWYMSMERVQLPAMSHSNSQLTTNFTVALAHFQSIIPTLVIRVNGQRWFLNSKTCRQLQDMFSITNCRLIFKSSTQSLHPLQLPTP